ncbi:MAG: hypothetical protein HC770_12825 [Pseudanabaena sp. CRU_2_10]|nr:hypothetical protein [Pseudanabaena sp. CRU_2_10]
MAEDIDKKYVKKTIANKAKPPVKPHSRLFQGILPLKEMRSRMISWRALYWRRWVFLK